MPMTYSVDRRQSLLLAVAEGSLTYVEFMRHLEQERVDQGFRLRELIDATRATSATVTPGEVRGVVERLRELSGQQTLGPTAVVVGDDVSYGVLRRLAMLVEGVCRVRPFRDGDAAAEWLSSGDAA
jgi:hypothetical protein